MDSSSTPAPTTGDSRPQSSGPSPALFFDTISAYQRSFAMKGAIDLDLFSAIAAGNDTVDKLAGATGASERGVRILCDYLTILGILTKADGHYALTGDSAAFLDRQSPHYMGNAVDFLLTPALVDSFRDFAGVVRSGRTALPGEGSVAPEHPMWVDFARAMAPMMALPAHLMAGIIPIDDARPVRVLDIAAGHGLFGITLAQRHPQLEVTALDWPAVLEVARENAESAGVSGRHNLLPGDAFETDFGGPYDLVLLTNFLHHFDAATNVKLLEKVRSALSEGGRAVTLEFVPNEDRVSPPVAAAFSMTMLASTRAGDAYTFSELEKMFREAGFARSELIPLPPTPQQMIISYTNA